MACVDIDVEGARESVRALGGGTAEMLAGRVYGTISEALERHPAEACVIYASTAAHAALVVESLGQGLHTLCVKPMAVTQEEMRRIVGGARGTAGAAAGAGAEQEVEPGGGEDAGVAAGSRTGSARCWAGSAVSLCGWTCERRAGTTR